MTGWWLVGGCALALPWLASASPYVLVLAVDVLVATLFAASLHFIMGPGGMHSFGHAAYFGLAAYGAALLVKRAGVPMEWTILLAPLVAAFFEKVLVMAKDETVRNNRLALLKGLSAVFSSAL